MMNPGHKTFGKTLVDASAQDGILKVARLSGDLRLTARLRELGFIVGEPIQVLGRAPFGEPILVEVRGATVALRKREAACVEI